MRAQTHKVKYLNLDKIMKEQQKMGAISVSNQSQLSITGSQNTSPLKQMEPRHTSPLAINPCTSPSRANETEGDLPPEVGRLSKLSKQEDTKVTIVEKSN